MSFDLGTIGTIVSIIVAVAAGVAALIKSSYATARYEDAERRINGMRTDLDLADDREKRMERELAALTGRVRALEDENKTLRSLVPTTDELAEVRRVAQAHYDETTKFYREWKETRVWLGQMLETVLAEIKKRVM